MKDKKKDDEMLVTHAAPEAEPEAAGREPESPLLAGMKAASLDELQALLAAAARPADRAAILQEIQRRFGNQAAEAAATGARGGPGDKAPEGA